MIQYIQVCFEILVRFNFKTGPEDYERHALKLKPDDKIITSVQIKTSCKERLI